MSGGRSIDLNHMINKTLQYRIQNSFLILSFLTHFTQSIVQHPNNTNILEIISIGAK